MLAVLTIIGCLQVICAQVSAASDQAPGAAASAIVPLSENGLHSAAELNAIAWRFYKNGKHARAESFFRKALNARPEDPKITVSILLGLGYTEMALGNYTQAMTHFTAAADFPPSVDPAGRQKALEGQFLSAWKAAAFQRAWQLLDENRQAQWAAAYLKTDVEIELCIKAGDLSGAKRLLKKYHISASRRNGTPKTPMFRSLLSFLNSGGVRSPLLCGSLLSQGFSRREVLDCIGRLKDRMPDQYAQLRKRARATHPEWFASRKKSASPEISGRHSAQITLSQRAATAFDAREYRNAAMLARQALGEDPSNTALVSLIAWSYFHLEQWTQAEKWFRRGLEIKKNPDLLVGLAWTLIKQGKCGECVDLLGSGGSGKDTRLSGALLRALECAGNQQYRAHNWSAAAAYFRRRIALAPATDPGVQQLLAWAYYQDQKWPQAAAAFDRLLATGYRKAWLEAYGHALAMQGQLRAVVEAYEKYHARGDYPGSLKRFLYAAGIRETDMCRAAGCENSAALGVRYRHRSGDEGLDRLDDWSLPAAQARFRMGDRLTLLPEVTYRHISNGRDSDDFATGYLASLWAPDGGLSVEAGIGVVGAGTRVGAWPVWHLGISGQTPLGRLAFTAYRRTVDDSLLSMAGMHDDIHGQWGGVSQTGAAIAWSGDIEQINLRALFDYGERTGTSVKNNRRYLVNVSAGKTIAIGERLGQYLQEPWAGIYATWFGFEKNLNYFTWGNGGYFSPRSFVSAGPVLSLRTIEGKRWIASMDASVGYIHSAEDDGWQYPENTGTARGWSYAGQSRDLIGFGIHARGAWKISSHVAIEGRAALDKSADYNQYLLGIQLVFYPDGIAGLFFDGLPRALPELP